MTRRGRPGKATEDPALPGQLRADPRGRGEDEFGPQIPDGRNGRRRLANIRWLAFALALAATTLLAAFSASAQASTLLDTEFNGSAVSAPWVVNTGGGNAHPNYWTNQCWMNDRKHVSVSGGYLALTATYAPRGGDCGTHYESGAINVPASAGSYLHGTAQARIKVSMPVW